MRVMITLENIQMDGVKRAATVLGNELIKNSNIDLCYYSLSDSEIFFKLEAPLIIANPPIDHDHANFFGSSPYDVYNNQINDLILQIRTLRIDTVILSAGLLTSFSPLIKEQCSNTRLIGWMHNNYNTYISDYYYNMREEFIEGLAAVDQIIVLTDTDYEFYKKHNQNIKKIYNPLTLTPECSDLSQPIIAFTGRIAIEHKGIDLLLQVAQSLTFGWKISIAGTGESQEIQRFKRLCVELNVEDKIIYRGGLKDTELCNHYQTASIFVSTSRWEGMPLVIGEAMAAGLPVVAMSNTGSDEFLQKGQYGFLTGTADINEFCKCLNMLIKKPTLRKYFSNQSKIRASAFHRHKIVNDWIPIL